MADQFYLFRRGNGRYYAQDRISKRQTSLNTSNASQAKRLIAAKNQASEMPALNMAMARAYLTAKSPELVNRTWADVMHDLELSYSGSTLLRWGKVIKSPPFRLLANIKLIDTESSHFMEVLRHKRAGVSTNVWLRILHNRALDLGWLLAPVLVKRAWPKIRYGQKRAITAEEHEKIIVIENLDDYRLYFKLLWETGGSQSDIANLSHDDIDRENNRLYYCRQKVATRGFGSVTIAIGPRIREILKELPKEGWIFPRLRMLSEDERASHFRKVCLRSEIKGVTLHSYRYAWAERAQCAGMPEREAMAHLGHSSRAVHQAYARRVETVTMPLEYYEAKKQEKIIAFDHLQTMAGDTPECAVAVG